jgi:hypothetical protein
MEAFFSRNAGDIGGGFVVLFSPRKHRRQSVDAGLQQSLGDQLRSSATSAARPLTAGALGSMAWCGKTDAGQVGRRGMPQASAISSRWRSHWR